MFRLLLITMVICTMELLPVPMAAAQQSSPGAVSLSLRQQLAQTEARRRNRIAGNMLLSAEEARRFWPVYDDYRRAVVDVRERQLDVVVQYADAYNRGGLGPDESRVLLAEAMRLEAERHRLKREYMRQAAGVLEATRQLRLYQVETRLDAEAQAGVLAQIPLAQ